MATNRLRVINPDERISAFPGPISYDLAEPVPGISVEDGVLKIEHPDGSVTIDTNPDTSDEDKQTTGFHENLARKIDSQELSRIAAELLDGIDRDIESRRDWLEMRSKGITLLGLKIEDQNANEASSSAPFEGMSRIRHPILLEATVRFQANARSELLPASGPLKVRNDQIIPPPMPGSMPPMDMTPGGLPPPNMPSRLTQDDLADALERGFNHYLTVTATEYIPDTDRMLFYVGFGGDGFKKVFNCPLRRRPVSESVDAEDLIVSNSATDLQNCGRVTHRIKMRKSTLRRMQILGEYRKVEIGRPNPTPPDAVEKKKAEIDGQRYSIVDPKDEDYTIYECYCELDLNEFAPKQFKGEGVPLPYRVTIEKDSRQVLSIIRNWNEEDEQCLPKRFFVQFPFIRGLGFYGYGYIHLLGNLATTLTAGWRETIDSGMFANFPGFLYAKAIGRQLSNNLRVPPGGGVAVELGAQQDIRSAIMPLPYKDTSPAFTGFLANVAEEGQRLAATAEINVGEGKQDAPVGTTLALIEQATKMLDAVHKRMHAAQAEEFLLLKERFREDPEAFWRHNKTPTMPWTKELFLKALNDHNLVPVADPNNPTSLHRMAKGTLIKQLATASPQLYNVKAVDTRILRMSGIDTEGLFNEQPTPPPPDPRMIAIQQKSEQVKLQTQAQLQDTAQKLKIELMKVQNAEAERESREKIEQMKLLIEAIRLQEEQLINAQDVDMEQIRHEAELMMEQAKQFSGMQMDAQKATHDLALKRAEGAHNLQVQREMALHDMEQKAHERQMARDQHEHDMQVGQERHAMEMEHAKEKHAADLEHAKALAKAKASAIRKAPAKGTKQ